MVQSWKKWHKLHIKIAISTSIIIFFPYVWFRREQGKCTICWTAAAVTDIILSGKGTRGVTKQASGTKGCCSYGTKGGSAAYNVYDCLHVPGALKSDDSVVKGVCQAGGNKGLRTASGTKTSIASALSVCCEC